MADQLTPLERKSLDAFNQMWDAWKSPTEESIMQSISTWANWGKGFGSGISEIWKNKNDFQEYSELSFIQSHHGFEVENKWLETNHLADDLVALWGEIVITVKLPLKNIVIDPIRVTGVYKNIGEEMKLVQWHASEPDVSDEDELWAGTGDPKRYENISILFTDFVGFAKIVTAMEPEKLVGELNEIFAEFDSITKRHGLEKIKTIGDAYMAAGGLLEQKDHAISAVSTAIEMLSYLQRRNQKRDLKWNMRVGVHSGSAVGGVIGSEKLSFDLWGDTVNLASRIESSGLPNKVNLSSNTYERIGHVFPCEFRGAIEIKDKRQIDMYFVK